MTKKPAFWLWIAETQLFAHAILFAGHLAKGTHYDVATFLEATVIGLAPGIAFFALAPNAIEKIHANYLRRR